MAVEPDQTRPGQGVVDVGTVDIWQKDDVLLVRRHGGCKFVAILEHIDAEFAGPALLVGKHVRRTTRSCWPRSGCTLRQVVAGNAVQRIHHHRFVENRRAQRVLVDAPGSGNDANIAAKYDDIHGDGTRVDVEHAAWPGVITDIEPRRRWLAG